MTIPAHMQAKEGFMRLQALGEQLLPGIPDEITFDHIAPNLRWTDFNSLSSVSHAWRHAIRTRHVYNARVRSHSTVTLLLLKSMDSDSFHKVSLFDTRKNSFHQLPPIPNLEGGFPRNCELVSLDGKVYVLGGLVERKNGHHSTDAVYVLDLAGRSQWKKCASMTQSRLQFGCGVLNGKIYVSGGYFSLQPVRGAEVYDAKENIWSPIKPMISLRSCHRVETVGAELLVHSGLIFDRDYFDATKNQIECTYHDSFYEHIHSADSFEVYNPGKAEWREVKPFMHNMSNLLMANGKIHGIRENCLPGSFLHIDVYDLDTGSWAHQHSFDFDAILSNGESVSVYADSVLMVENELFAILSWGKIHPGLKDTRRYSLLQSKEFGSKDKDDIMWQPKTKTILLPAAFYSTEICSAIKL